MRMASRITRIEIRITQLGSRSSRLEIHGMRLAIRATRLAIRVIRLAIRAPAPRHGLAWASTCSWCHELGPPLKEAEAGGVKILWVLVRACSYEETPLKNYQAVVSPPGKPLAKIEDRDEAWVPHDVAVETPQSVTTIFTGCTPVGASLHGGSGCHCRFARNPTSDSRPPA